MKQIIYEEGRNELKQWINYGKVFSSFYNQAEN